MIEEKSEAIMCQIPQKTFDEGTAWLAFTKVRSLANKSFMTNFISAVYKVT